MIRQDELDYVPDNGFSTRVLGALPPPNQHADRRRLALLLGAAAIGCVIAGALAGPSFSVDCLGFTQRVTTAMVTPMPGTETALTIGSIAILLAAVASGWWALARSH